MSADHPIVTAAIRLGLQTDVILSLRSACPPIDARITALAAETDPVAGLAERDAIVRRIHELTVGINTELFMEWHRSTVNRLNAQIQRLYPDWRTREGLLLNRYPYTRK